jgi:phosphate transport system substrate-binding protein
MKRLMLISLVAILLFGNKLEAQKIKGSDTMLPLSQKIAEILRGKDKNNQASVTGGGSGVGISALIEGSCDIAMASRKMKLDEKNKVSSAGKKLSEITVAYDALAIIVNPKNSVSKLTREQLEGIFTGKITNWKEVGGKNMKIVTYSRETSSGTYEFFKESVLKNKNFMNSILSMPATGAIIQSVSQTEGAIGYIGIAYINKNIKLINVSYDKGKTFIAPSIKTAKDKTYPIVRPLFYYYTDKSSKESKKFVDFILSKEGQKIVEKEGYVNLLK